MNDVHEDRLTVYEVGYLLVSVPEELVSAEADKVKKLIADAGASIITEELPHRQRLAYTIRRKTVSGSYDKYDEAYFGWVKFEAGSSKVEAMKKAIELIPSVLRMILITTVRENTYLGKRATAIMPKGVGAAPIVEDKKDAAPVSIEDMDKSIDDMVKEA